MDANRRRRLEQLREEFEVSEKNGDKPLHEVLAETIADYLNRKHGREVVVRRKVKDVHVQGYIGFLTLVTLTVDWFPYSVI